MHCRCYRRNADEDFRRIQRERLAADTLENRTKHLLARLRVGDITMDRVEAASEIGCPEAQIIVSPSGVVGWDWAIAVLAEHFSLRNFVAEAVLHVLETFYNRRLIVETCPRYDSGLRQLMEVETLLGWEPSWHAGAKSNLKLEPLIKYISQTFSNSKFDFSRYLRNLPREGQDRRFMDRTTQHIRDLMGQHTPELLQLWGFTEVNRFLTAVRNVWLLPPSPVQSVTDQTSVGDRAYEAINALSYTWTTPIEAARELAAQEAEWQRQHIIEWLLQ